MLLQAACRRTVQREPLLKLHAAVCIQRTWREHAKHQSVRMRAAIVIQAYERGRVARTLFRQRRRRHQRKEKLARRKARQQRHAMATRI